MPTGDGSMTVRPSRDTARLSVPVASSRVTCARGACVPADKDQVCPACPACSACAGAVVRSAAASEAQSAATAVLIGTAIGNLRVVWPLRQAPGRSRLADGDGRDAQVGGGAGVDEHLAAAGQVDAEVAVAEVVGASRGAVVQHHGEVPGEAVPELEGLACQAPDPDETGGPRLADGADQEG